MKMQGYTIVDVRSQMEFQGGHVAGSINIPLQEVPNRVQEFADMPQPLLLCCASVVKDKPQLFFNNEELSARMVEDGWM